MKTRAFFLLMSSLIMVRAANGTPGTEGGSFLDIPVGARPAALGSAYSALATDAYGAVWNPGGLGFLSSAQLAGQHLDYLDSITDEFLGVALPIGQGKALGLSLQYLGSGDIPATDNSGNAMGTFSSHYGAYSIAYGQLLTDTFSLGTSAKWINAKISDASADAYAGSVGALYRPIENLSLATVVDNFGSRLTFLNTGDSLPLTGRLGAAYTVQSRWTLLLEGDYAQSGLASAHTGVEWRPFEGTALRAGYRTDTLRELSPLAGVTAGVGLTFWGQEFAYAWLPMGDLGNTHYFSFVGRFGQPTHTRGNLVYYRPLRLPEDAWHSGREEQKEADLEDIIQLITAPDKTRVAESNL